MATNKLKLLFFCGERSPWGYAHIEPLLRESRFEIVAVVWATEKRWRTFRRALSGEEQTTVNWTVRVKRLLARLLRRAPLLARMLGRASLANTQRALSLLEKHKIPVLWCDDVNAVQSIELFQGFQADLIFSAAYPQIFKPHLLLAFPFGAFNSHPSLLPRCRGAHPVFWAIASGESKSGSTIHFMTPELDQGDIVSQIEFDLGPHDTYSQLYAKLITTIPNLLAQFADFLVTSGCKTIPQDMSKSTYFRNDRQIHRRIFWAEMDAVQIHNLVRACNGNAYFWHGQQQVLVRQVEPAETNRNMTNNIKVPPGTVVDIRNGIPVIAVRSGFVILLHITAKWFRKPSFSIGQILS